MYPVSDRFLSALNGSHTAVSRVEVWRGGEQLEADLAVSGGRVEIDGSSPVRRRLNLQADPDAWSLLAPTGTEIRPFRGIRFIDGTAELVPLGRFVVDDQSVELGPGGTVQVTAPDRWVDVQRARFLTPRKMSGQFALTQAAAFVTEVVDVDAIVTASSGARTRATFDRDRDQAVIELARAAGAELFFDADGRLVVRDVPTLEGPPAWTVSLLYEARRERTRQRAYSVVVATAAATDGTTPFAPQIVRDDDPQSPTFADGPFGEVPRFYASPLVRNATQATSAARAILERARGLAVQLRVTSAVNPALEAGDRIDVVFPDGRSERHQVDTLTIPLAADETSTITGRTSRGLDDMEGLE